MNEEVTYSEEDGREYAWYKGRRYWIHSGYYVHSPESLHTQIWKDNFGPIPEGFCVHHKNGNKRDNSIENLECVSKADHSRAHGRNFQNQSIRVRCKSTGEEFPSVYAATQKYGRYSVNKCIYDGKDGDFERI